MSAPPLSAITRLLALLALAACSTLRAEVPDGFVEEEIATKLSGATALTVAPDGRIFIAEQTGLLRVWKDGRLLATPALDLTTRVDTYWERGLVGVTLHPDFPRTPHLFVLYVAKEPYPHHVISRFTLVGDQVAPASERILLEGDDQRAAPVKLPGAHQGGPIRFGPDGQLYVALGEQTAGAPSQSLTALDGKILRVGADGSIPADNPFYAQLTGKYRAIWALGLRNPFGLAFQPETGRLFECDVGQSSWEEVNEILRGKNYGWPEAEGLSTKPGFHNPLLTYPPAIGRCICGAAFYPRAAIAGHEAETFPEKWRGQFVFADWAANWVHSIDPAAPEKVNTFARGLDMPVALEVAPDGSLLVLNRGTIWRDEKKWKAETGSLVRIRYVGTQPNGGVTQKQEPWPKMLAEALDFKSFWIPPTVMSANLAAEPWHPGLSARRWMVIPSSGKLEMTEDGQFAFPIGTLLVQEYSVEKTGAPFETQVLSVTSARTARAAAYRSKPGAKPLDILRFLAPEGDANLIEESQIVPLPSDPDYLWFSPAPERSLNLDLAVTGFVVPINPRQTYRQGRPHGWDGLRTGSSLTPEKIAALPKLAPLDDTTAPLELRVRTYLDVNCAGCHRPGGSSRGLFDARITTPLAEAGLIDGPLAAGDLGLPGAKVIVPGKPELSILLQRVRRDDFVRMPPINVNHEPQPLVPILEAWIRELAH